MNRTFLKCAALAGMAAMALLAMACQLESIQTGRTVLNLSLNIPVPFAQSGNQGEASRFLLTSGGNVRVKITRNDATGSVLMDEDLAVTADSNGLPVASVNLDNAPQGIPLNLLAQVEDSDGIVWLQVSDQFTVTGGTNQTRSITLAPDPSYPGITSLDSQTADLVIPSGSFRILSHVVDETEAGKHNFWSLDTSSGQTSVFVLDAAGNRQATYKISAPQPGVLFTPSTPQILYFIAYNPGTADANLGIPVLSKDLLLVSFDFQDGHAPVYQTVAKGGKPLSLNPAAKTNYSFYGWFSDPTCITAWNFATDTASADMTLYAGWHGVASLVSFSLTINQPSTPIAFSSSALVLAGNASVTLACSDILLAAQTSGWEWYVDAVKVPGSSAGNFTFDPLADGWSSGSHVISVVTSQSGVSYSGSLLITVTPVSPPGRFTVTYSNRYADNGLAPQDTTLYTAASNTVTLATNSGSLSRAGYEFLGWTQAGTGTNFAVGASFTISSDQVFYPRWSLVGMKTVNGGTFQRDNVPMNLTSVKSFMMGLHEVSQEQYAAVMGSIPAANSSSAPNVGDRKPVIFASWYDAIEFCNKLSAREGLDPVYSLGGSTDTSTWGSKGSGWDSMRFDMNATGYRLPTVSEWIWAAIGGLSDAVPGNIAGGVNIKGYTKTFAGSTGTNSGSILDFANFASSASIAGGSLLPNELGLYDMSGNAWEKTWDWDATWPTGSMADYTGPVTGYQRTVMGLGFESAVADTTSFTLGTKGNDVPSYTSVNNGFRLARSLPSSAYLPRSGLVGEWRFDGTQNDTSGSGSSVAVAGTSWSMANRKSLGASAWHFSTEQAIDAPAAMMAPEDSFTISLWINPDAFPSSGIHKIIRQNGLNEGDFQYWVNLVEGGSPNLEVMIASNNRGTPYARSTFTINASVWTHVALTWTPVIAGSTGTLRVWINGTLADTQANVSLSPTSDGLPIHPTIDSHFQIGGGYNITSAADWNYTGGVDDLRLYKRALSAAEIQLLYQE